MKTEEGHRSETAASRHDATADGPVAGKTSLALPSHPSVAAIRRARGLTQQQVGEQLGRSQSVVSRWERGVLAPTVPDLVALAGILTVGAYELGIAFVDRGRCRSRHGDSIESRRGLGSRLRTARLASELEGWDVARRSGMTARRLRRLEAGGQPSISEFLALARVLPQLRSSLESTSLDAAADLTKVTAGPSYPESSTLE